MDKKQKTKSDLLKEIESLKKKVTALEGFSKSRHISAQASEKIFREVIEKMGLITIGVDKNGNLNLFNKEAENVSRYKASEVLGHSYVGTLVAPEEADRVKAYLEDGSKRGYFVRDVECDWITKDGDRRVILWNYIYVKDTNESNREIIGFATDITERKQAEYALMQSEQKFRTVFDSSAAAITVADDKERIISWNKFTENLFGMDHKDLYLKPISSFYPPEEWQRIRSMNIRQKGMQHHLETKMYKKSGQTIDIDVSITVLKDPTGKITGSIGIIRDITERKRAEHALMESEEKFRTVFENSAVAITVADDKERIISWNKFTENLFDMNRDDLYLKPISSFYPPEEWLKIRSMNIRQKGMQHHLETKMYKKSGQTIDIDVSITVLKDANGKITGSIGIIRDITERKLAETEQKAKEAAVAMARAKSEFLANMSHEIRTPINGIIGMIELLRDTDLTPEQAEYVHTAKTSADGLLTLINDILDFSKIEAGKLALDLTHFNLRDSLGDTVSTLAVRAHNKGLELICHIPPNIPDALVGDSGRLRQIIVNLLGNSIKFTEKGEIMVRVDVETQTDEEVALHFAVSDTGIGIPMPKQQLIFEPFEQSDSSMTRKYGGTGLGLSISYQLVHMMGGQIWVESPSNSQKIPGTGPGSTFHFTVRFGLSRSKRHEQRTEEQLSCISNLPVLVVEDNATTRHILEEILINWRMKPTLAENGFSAKALIEQAQKQGRKFPIVLLDTSIPDVDAFSLAEQILQMPELSDTKIIILTATGRVGDVTRCQTLGVTAYLPKPIKQSHLLDTILMSMASNIGEKVHAKVPPRISLSANATGPRLHILLAEDNLVNQQVAVRLLQKRGHTVVVATNGRKALAALDKENFDAVLMDVQMPEMDGYETASAIRTKEKITGKHVPIIAMTAHVMKGDGEKCLAAGMDGYVPKPFRPQELFDTLEKLVNTTTVSKPTTEEDEEFDERKPGQVFNRVEGLSHVEGDLELFHQILTVFLEDAPEQFKKIKQAFTAGDAVTVEREAHGLKGASANIGAELLQRQAFHMEKASKEKALDRARTHFAAAESEFEKLKSLLLNSEFSGKPKAA